MEKYTEVRIIVVDYDCEYEAMSLEEYIVYRTKGKEPGKLSIEAITSTWIEEEPVLYRKEKE